MPKWTREMALEIISAGFKSMARKYHPDVGGTHDQMLDLTATKEHLEKVMTGGSDWRDHRRDSDSYRRQQEQANREHNERMRRAQEEARQRTYWRNQQKTEPGEVPIEPYPHDSDYFQLVDVTIMATSEKAIKIKISGVKQPQWLPKSQLHDEMDGTLFTEGEVITVIFTRWIAQQKGWLK